MMATPPVSGPSKLGCSTQAESSLRRRVWGGQDHACYPTYGYSPPHVWTDLPLEACLYDRIDQTKLREGIGYVTQESLIFNDTVQNNVSLWEC